VTRQHREHASRSSSHSTRAWGPSTALSFATRTTTSLRMTDCEELFRGTPHAGASASEDLLQLLAHILVVDEVSALRRSQAEIDGLDKARVIFQIAADYLLRQLVGVEALLSGDLR
jgi:hypothetical protein